MIKVSVKQKDKRGFTIFVPYAILSTGSWVLSSKMLWKFIQNQMEKEEKAKNQKVFIPTSIDRKDLRLFLKTLKQYKGLTIVDIVDKDGTKVFIKL